MPVTPEEWPMAEAVDEGFEFHFSSKKAADDRLSAFRAYLLKNAPNLYHFGNIPGLSVREAGGAGVMHLFSADLFSAYQAFFAKQQQLKPFLPEATPMFAPPVAPIVEWPEGKMAGDNAWSYAFSSKKAADDKLNAFHAYLRKSGSTLIDPSWGVFKDLGFRVTERYCL